jgi:ribonuclease P protein component
MSVPGGLIAVRRTDPEAPVRCGFVVSKAVGNAVVRNVVKRRLRAACASLVTQYRGADLVVRADRHAQDVTVEVWQAVLDGALEKVVAS